MLVNIIFFQRVFNSFTYEIHCGFKKALCDDLRFDQNLTAQESHPKLCEFIMPANTALIITCDGAEVVCAFSCSDKQSTFKKSGSVCQYQVVEHGHRKCLQILYPLQLDSCLAFELQNGEGRA